MEITNLQHVNIVLAQKLPEFPEILGRSVHFVPQYMGGGGGGVVTPSGSLPLTNSFFHYTIKVRSF